MLCIGSLSGLAEAALAVWRQEVRHFPTGEFVAAEVFWMTPLAAVATMIPVALVIVVAARFARRSGWLRVAPAAFTTMSAFSLLRALRVGMSNIAAAVLALGCAAVVHRLVRSRPRLARLLATRTAPVLFLALLAWALAVPAWRHAAAARTVAALPEPPRDAPDVLIIIWDAARALDLSLNGYTRPTTPELERFARRGVVFERAFATAPWSLPSHASMFTGRYPTELTTARREPLDDGVPTVAEVMSRYGWATAAFTANLYYGSSAFGLARGFTWYDDRPPIDARVVLSTWRLSRLLLWLSRDRATENAPSAMRPGASDITDALLDWVDGTRGRPFFAVINQFDAHDPYFPPPPFDTAFAAAGGRFWLDEELREYSADELSQLRDAYDGALRYLDHELGRLLSALDARGRLDNTLVIITADHGEQFGEHGADLVMHARSLYSPVLLVPLVLVHPPDIPSGVRSSRPVSIRDIPATVIDVAGLGPDVSFPGTSLLRRVRDTAAFDSVPEYILSVAESSPMGGVLPTWPIAAGHMYSLVSGDLHYILTGDGREQLFDLSADILERDDLAGRPEYEAWLRRFRSALDSIAGPASTRRPYRLAPAAGRDGAVTPGAPE